MMFLPYSCWGLRIAIVAWERVILLPLFCPLIKMGRGMYAFVFLLLLFFCQRHQPCCIIRNLKIFLSHCFCSPLLPDLILGITGTCIRISSKAEVLIWRAEVAGICVIFSIFHLWHNFHRKILAWPIFNKECQFCYLCRGFSS